MHAEISGEFDRFNGTTVGAAAVEAYVAAIQGGLKEYEASIVGSNVLQRGGSMSTLRAEPRSGSPKLITKKRAAFGSIF
jgi:hypothetical protein